MESSQETLTEVETETSDEDDETLCSQQSDEEGQTVVKNGNDNRPMENEQIQDKESSIVETSEGEEQADTKAPSSTPEFEEEIVYAVRK